MNYKEQIVLLKYLSTLTKNPTQIAMLGQIADQIRKQNNDNFGKNITLTDTLEQSGMKLENIVTPENIMNLQKSIGTVPAIADLFTKAITTKIATNTAQAKAPAPTPTTTTPKAQTPKVTAPTLGMSSEDLLKQANIDVTGEQGAGETGTGGNAAIRNNYAQLKWIRDLTSQYGFNTTWDDKSKTALITVNTNVGNKILKIDPNTMQKLGGGITNDGKLYVDSNAFKEYLVSNGILPSIDAKPLRDVAKDYGIDVSWDENNKQIILKNQSGAEYKVSTADLSQFGWTLANGTTWVDEKTFKTNMQRIGLMPIESTTDLTNIGVQNMTQSELDAQMKIIDWQEQSKSWDDFKNQIMESTDTTIQKIKDTYASLVEQSVKNIEDAVASSTAAFEKNKGALDEYAGIQKGEIDKAVQVAKSSSKEDMAARGIYFSGLTSRALATIEAQGISEKAKVDAQVAKWKADIDMQIAVLTANSEMSKATLKNQLMANEALTILQEITKEQDKLDAIKQIQVGLQANISTTLKSLPYANEAERRIIAAQTEKEKQEEFYRMGEYWLKVEGLELDKEKLQLERDKVANDLKEFYLGLNLDYARLGLDKQKIWTDFVSHLEDTYGLDLSDVMSLINGGNVDTSKYSQPVSLKDLKPEDINTLVKNSNALQTAISAQGADTDTAAFLQDLQKLTLYGGSADVIKTFTKYSNLGTDVKNAIINSVKDPTAQAGLALSLTLGDNLYANLTGNSLASAEAVTSAIQNEFQGIDIMDVLKTYFPDSPLYLALRQNQQYHGGR
jgi:hypothetical protein